MKDSLSIMTWSSLNLYHSIIINLLTGRFFISSQQVILNVLYTALNPACAINSRSGAGTPLAKIWQTGNGVNIYEYAISGVKYERINKSGTRNITSKDIQS